MTTPTDSDGDADADVAAQPTAAQPTAAQPTAAQPTAALHPGAQHPGAQRKEQIPVLAAISVGGVCGALARYGIATAWPHGTSGFAWSTFVINVTGCLLIGVLMVIVTEVVPHRRLVRPFFGVGVLGGYTTFSTYVVDITKNAGAGAALTALLYMSGTAVAALLAVWAGNAAATAVVRRTVRKPGAAR